MFTKFTVQRASFVAALICSTTSAIAASPRFQRHDPRHENEEQEHYRDQGAHPQKATAKGIVLQSRALLDKAGTTYFELTTGQLDSTALPPGNINEVKLRAVRPEGKRGEGKKEWQKEFEDLRNGGYVLFPLTGLAHNELLDVKAEVGVEGYRGEEGHQDVNLKLQDVVKYRPDMVVQKLDYAAVARPGTAVQFSATIAEGMGDVGGHADCVLRVDGQQVDAAKGIWVDAAGVVTCRLSYTFPTSGMHAVSVRVENCCPADYDAANNELSGQIQIQNPAQIFYSSSAFESTTVTDKLVDTYASALATVPDKEQHDTSTQIWQGRYFSGQIPSAINLPLKNVGYSDSSGGSPLLSVNFSNLAADATTASDNALYTTMSVIQRYDDTTKGWMTVRVYRNAATGDGLTTVDWAWDAGDATYHSDGYCKSSSIYTCIGGDYTLNRTTTTTTGLRVALAANYAANVAVDDGTQYTAQPSMDLVSTSASRSSPTVCVRQNTGGPGMGKICTTSSITSTSRSGSASKLQ